MELVDTHAHLSSNQFRGEVGDLIARARDAEVTRIITIGTDIEDSAGNVQLAAEHAGVFATVGVHPTSIHEVGSDWLQEIRELASQSRVVAIGEIGLDYFHPPRDGSEVSDWRSRQGRFFREQLDLAVEFGLPVVIHQRESSEDVRSVMQEYAGRVNAVFHCFVGDVAEAKELIDLGFHVSFTGVATYKNAANVADCARQVPLKRMMVETDCPYLTPVPKRGTRNEPAFVSHTAAFIAESRGMSLAQFAEATTATAVAFFGLE